MKALTVQRAMLYAILSVVTPVALAAELKLPSDGWASWKVSAVDQAPAWCCWSWRNSNATSKPCQLDGADDSYGSRDDTKTDSVRIYARLEGGKIQRVRALSASCPVQASTDAHDLGTVSDDDSARWLAQLVQPRNTNATIRDSVSRDAMAALAIHHGDTAQELLAGLARNDARKQTRKEALFWMTHLRGEPGAKVATAVMFGDDDPEVREHAAFAVSQSTSPEAASDLIRLANTDTNARVRGQAWFWLAKTESPATEAAINSALRKENDDEVHNQAIFALSQLPDDRATKALIAVVEDQSRPSEDRKHAIFWLAQSDATAAQEYLEKTLIGAESARR